MRMLVDARSELLSICDQAIEGKLSLKGFYSIWPGDIEQSEFLSCLYQDIEEGVQHFPGHWLTGAPDYKMWMHSEFFRKLSIDRLLLVSDKSASDLASIRSNAIKQDLSVNEVLALL